VNRRSFLAAMAASGFWDPAWGTPLPVHFRKPSPWDALRAQIEPGHDEFPRETEAMEVVAALERVLKTGTMPLSPGFRGVPPLANRYRAIAADTWQAEFGGVEGEFGAGVQAWLKSLGTIRAARFYRLPADTVRYEIAATDTDGLTYRVGTWKLRWSEGHAEYFVPAAETLVRSREPLFRDITGEMFADAVSFREQLLRGLPAWRSRLDSASGIDVYGNNGVAVGDVDGDGWDEIYVCQPGGLPNRLYKNVEGTRMEDITERAGVGVLDDTASAMFVDFRNTGRQDLVVLLGSGPLLFLNDGSGHFTRKEDAFHFRAAPQGAFTGMAAADYDRDGRVDLYLCCYSYFQSEDQYRYPVPYHDAANGPPNFLLRNRLAADGSGAFEDVTAETGMHENNNRFSFAAAWCDYDGDGWPDLYVANDFGRKNLYENDRGHFHDVAREAGVEDIGPGMSAAWFDYDNDGRPDLYVANMWSDAGQRVVAEPGFRPAARPEMREAYRRHTKGNSLYRNRGDGTFGDAGAEQGVEMGRWAWCSDGHDFDNDRTPEIYVTSGMMTNSGDRDAMSFFWRQVVARSPVDNTPSHDYENGWNAINQFIREDCSWNGHEPNVFYRRRDGRYHDFSGVSGLDHADDSRSFAVTDLDGDGNLDIVLKSRLAPQVRLLENNSTGGRRAIAIRLTGVKSNRDAIGARVEVDGVVKFVTAGSGFLSQHTKQLHFGLGDASAAERVEVHWPSGARQEFRALPAGYRYEITEESADVKRTPFRPRPRKEPSRPLPPADNHTRAATAWLLEPVPLPFPQTAGTGPALLHVGEGSGPVFPTRLPVRHVDLRKESAETAAGYALFRRYLFDWRTGLELPLMLLVDEHGRAHKFYASLPPAEELARDLERMRDPARLRLALPFTGIYYAKPRRSYFKLGAAFYWAGYPELALAYLEEMLRQNPANDKTLTIVGQIHLDGGRAAQARPYLEKAIEVNPKSADAWNNLGGVEMEAGNVRKALDYYLRALSFKPGAAFLLLNAGQAYQKLGDLQSAEQMLQRAAESDPHDPEPSNQLGLLAATRNRNDEARRWFQQAITIRKNYFEAINNLGVLYLRMGQPNDAIAAFEYGIQMAPEEDMLYLNLGRTYVSLGDRAKARQAMERLLERKPGNTAATKAIRDLETR
jgi:tetratricopeptide (TPR) repeat protein